VAVVRIPPALRPEADGQRQVELAASNLAGLFDGLISAFPGLGSRLLEDGEVASFLNVFVDGEDVRTLDGLATAVQPDSTVLLLPAMAGGAVASRLSDRLVGA
jgi:sulfur-carrier protein